jgi:hypothetical protein
MANSFTNFPAQKVKANPLTPFCRQKGNLALDFLSTASAF